MNIDNTEDEKHEPASIGVYELAFILTIIIYIIIISAS